MGIVRRQVSASGVSAAGAGAGTASATIAAEALWAPSRVRRRPSPSPIPRRRRAARRLRLGEVTFGDLLGEVSSMASRRSHRRRCRRRHPGPLRCRPGSSRRRAGRLQLVDGEAERFRDGVAVAKPAPQPPSRARHRRRTGSRCRRSLPGGPSGARSSGFRGLSPVLSSVAAHRAGLVAGVVGSSMVGGSSAVAGGRDRSEADHAAAGEGEGSDGGLQCPVHDCSFVVERPPGGCRC